MTVRFGMFSDLHCSLPGEDPRGASERSEADLREGLGRFIDKRADFIVNLGDMTQPSPTVREQYEHVRSLHRLCLGTGIPVHTVFGNHEFQQLSAAEVLEIWQTDRFHHSFDIGPCRFLFLDTAVNPDGTHFSRDNFDWRYCVMDREQVSWLETRLAERKRTFIFTHANLYFDPAEEHAEYYMIRDHEKICGMLEESGCVEAVFQGHSHVFRDAVHRGIRFLNVPSPIITDRYSPDAFPVVEITENGFVYALSGEETKPSLT